MIIIFAINSY